MESELEEDKIGGWDEKGQGITNWWRLNWGNTRKCLNSLHMKKGMNQRVIIIILQ